MILIHLTKSKTIRHTKFRSSFKIYKNMGSPIRSSLFIILSSLLLLQRVEAKMSRKLMNSEENREVQHHQLLISKQKQGEDPESHIFFSVNDLKKGTKLPLCFSKKDPSILPPLLTRQEADSIPFSTNNLTFLVNHFSIAKLSPQAEAMAETLEHCERPSVAGEIKFCATSLESMLDSIGETLGFNTGKLRVLTTKIMSGNLIYPLQNYTFSEIPKELFGVKIMGCHNIPYPYAVYYCHGHPTGIRVFEVTIVGEKSGEAAVVPAACHMDTSLWDASHVAFRVLGSKPGLAPVCHFFPFDNLLWVKE